MRKLWIVGSLLAVLAVPAWADGAKAGTVTLDVTKADVRTVFQEIEKQAGVTIVADSAITGTVTANLQGIDADKAISIICRNKNAVVRKVYVSVRQVGSISPTKLQEALDSLKVLEGTGFALVSTDTEGKAATVFVKGMAMDTVQSSIMKKDSDYKLVYLISAQKDSSPTSSKTSTTSYAEAEKARVNALSQLSPDQQRQELLQGMRNMLGAPAGVNRDAFLDAVRQFVNTLPPRERGRIVNVGVNTPFQGMPNRGGPGVGVPGVPVPGGGGPGGGGPGGGGGNPPGGNPPSGEDVPPPPPL